MAKGKRTTRKKVQATEGKPFTLPTVPVKAETDEDAWGEDRLTLKQRLFVKFYVGEAHGNASEAARLAGYKDDNAVSLRQTAHETLTSPHVQRALSAILHGRFGSPDEVRQGIAEIAHAKPEDFLKLTKAGPDGEPGELVFDMNKAAEAASLGLIRGMDEDVIEVEGSSAKVIKRKIKFHDRVRALELLAKLNGQLIERHRHEGEVRFNPITLDGDKTPVADGDGEGKEG